MAYYNFIFALIGMSAGDNTLNIVLALDFVKFMRKVDPDASMEPKELRKLVMEHYIELVRTSIVNLIRCVVCKMETKSL